LLENSKTRMTASVARFFWALRESTIHILKIYQCFKTGIVQEQSAWVAGIGDSDTLQMLWREALKQITRKAPVGIAIILSREIAQYDALLLSNRLPKLSNQT
jgi:hypothetical protein